MGFETLWVGNRESLKQGGILNIRNVLILWDSGTSKVSKNETFKLRDSGTPKVRKIETFKLRDSGTPKVSKIETFKLRDSGTPKVSKIESFKLIGVDPPNVSYWECPKLRSLCTLKFLAFSLNLRGEFNPKINNSKSHHLWALTLPKVKQHKIF